MNWKFKKPETGTLAARLWKYRYLCLLALVGLALLLVPTREEAPQAETLVPATGAQEAAATRIELETRIEQALAMIDGAGEVRLVLTWLDDGQTIYQQDERVTDSGESSSSERTTASVSTAASSQQALVARTLSPVCAGALVVCAGGGSAAVRLAITEALRALTGLGSSQITVVKMKSS